MSGRVDCPICGGELPAIHRQGQPWTPQELLVVRRLVALGVSYASVGRLFGVKGNAIAEALRKELAA